MSNLLKLLYNRRARLIGTPRQQVAVEDVIRCQQNFRKPFYTITSSENGYPAKWTVRHE